MRIKYQTLDFSIRALEPVRLPPYKGSAFRGGFGNAFKRVVCVFRKKDCRDCPIIKECAYAYIFETPAPENSAVFNMNKYETIPHPFIIEPPVEKRQDYEAGSEISFAVVLIGKAVDYLPYFVMAFEYLGELGIGRGRGRYELIRVGIDGKQIYEGKSRLLKTYLYKFLDVPENIFQAEEPAEDPEREIAVDLVTPVRIKYQREFVSRLDFHILVTNLLRRLALLNYFHGERRRANWDHKKIIKHAMEVRLEKNEATWVDWERYSNRQKVRMKLGGLAGRIIYKGKLSEFLPLLKAGEVFHVGKGTSFGLGKYRIIQDY